MARKVTVDLIDDFDGKAPADETIEFRLDGTNYEIDLSTSNAHKMREALAPWIAAGRKVGSKYGGRRTPTTSGKEDLAAIREWAASNGMKVSSRGRISGEIITAYHNRGGIKSDAERAKAVMAKLKPVDAPEFSEAGK